MQIAEISVAHFCIMLIMSLTAVQPLVGRGLRFFSADAPRDPSLGFAMIQIDSCRATVPNPAQLMVARGWEWVFGRRLERLIALSSGPAPGMRYLASCRLFDAESSTTKVRSAELTLRFHCGCHLFHIAADVIIRMMTSIDVDQC